MKKLLTVFCLLLLTCFTAGSCGEAAFTPPKDVLEYIEGRWHVYELEDYLEQPDMDEQECSFALVWADDERWLLGFCRENGRLVNWLASTEPVPQTDRRASLYRYGKGMKIGYLWDSDNKYSYTTTGVNIGVEIPDQENESIESHVYYEWENRAFRLKTYSDHYWSVDIVGDTLYFWDIGNGLRNVIHTGRWTDTRISHVDFDQLYKRAGDVPQSAVNPPEIPWTCEEGALYAETPSFSPNQKYPVYQGPGNQYGRSGNGKASVSTNDWIQVFGMYDGWLLIQYAVNDTQCRVGWIAGEALPEHRKMNQLAFDEGIWNLVNASCKLTDDPLCSRAEKCLIPEGTRIERLALLGYAWAYVRVETEGKIAWGFLPTDKLGQM